MTIYSVWEQQKKPARINADCFPCTCIPSTFVTVVSEDLPERVGGDGIRFCSSCLAAMPCTDPELSGIKVERMEGWLHLARLGVFASQRIRWRQVPYFGALAAIAVFVSWKLSHNQDDNNKAERKTDAASTNDLEAHDGHEKLEGALQQGVPDENSELCTIHCPEESCDPNGVIAGNHTERVPPLDVRHGESDELNGRINEANFKDVTQDILPSCSDRLKRENQAINDMSMEVETLGSPVVYGEASNLNLAEGLAPRDTEGHLESAMQDVKDLREAPDSISTTVGDDKQADNNVDSMTASDQVNANNGMLEDSSIVSIKTCKSSRSYPLDDSPCEREHKVEEEISEILPDTDDAGQSLEGEINVPQHEGYHGEEDQTYYTQLCTSRFSSRGSEDRKTVVVDDAFIQAMKQSLTRKNCCCADKNSSSFYPPEHETVKVDISNIHCTPLPNSNNTGGKSCGAGDPYRSANASPDRSSQESNGEHFVQSPGPVNSVSKDANGTEAETSNSARQKDYAERLRSYDEYLVDPELSPTMRSQVLRARASVATYLDDSDDDDH